jgi:hypothetical protein
MFVIRTHGVVAATLGVLGLGACTDPEQNTDLRPAGPPDVLAVLVMTDAAGQLVEQATYCRPNDEKRPSLVGLPDFTTQQVCPADGAAVTDAVTGAYPDGWYVRIMFDELLDPRVETLTEVLDADTGEPTGTFTGSIASTRPVTLQCESMTGGGMVNVDYDGYYSPSGNRVTWPVGPSLVIKPNDPTLVATNTPCQITINDVVKDKGGTSVETLQRGPYKFRTAGIKVIAIDPPDDPEFDDPIDATQIWFDNPYIQFNTHVTLDSLCPDEAGAGLCDDEKVFSITDVAHPAEGPGYCDVSFDPCGTAADCEMIDPANSVCGRGFCTSGEPCNKPADCPTAGDHCGTTYAYDYLPFGLSETEFGIGPPEPIEVEHKYTMQFTAGAKLMDRCGRETTLGAPNVDDLTLVHFATNKFGPRTTPTSIVNGETAAANKRLQYNFTNIPNGHDTASGATIRPANNSVIAYTGATPEFTLSPMPQKLTGACAAAGAGCPIADLTTAELMIIPIDASGQISVQGHYKLNTEYTATIKAGTVVEDFYGKTYTYAMDSVIKWKTQPAIQMTGITMRYTGQLFGAGDKGTVTKPTPATTSDIRLAFNQSMDPTTLDVADVKVEPAVTGLAVTSPSGCGTFGAAGSGANMTGYLATCSLRLRGLFLPGEYKVTLVKDAKFKDIYGNEYTQAADQSITVTVEEAAPPIQCL